MLLIVLCNFLSRRSINDIGKSFSSIYQDRLVPAVDMVYLSENLYTKRLLVEKHLFSANDSTQDLVLAKLAKQDQQIDSLIRKFEKTFLTVEEAKNLRSFKNRVSEYARLEENVLHLCRTGNRQAGSELFNETGSTAFQESIRCLNDLIKIQYTEGQSLVRESQSESSQFNMIATLQISIAVVIGLLILGLIHSSKIIQQDRQPFHLN